MLAPFSEAALALEPGLYRHYKGNQYEVLHVGRHTESLEEVVVYRGGEDVWVRPLEMFVGNVIIDGEEVKRFAKC